MTTSGSAFFDTLRQALRHDASLRQETELALKLNLDRVNPSDRGNRFLFGSGVEWVVAAACSAAGVPLLPAGHQKVDVDLVNINDSQFGGWSIKSQSSPHKGDFRICNGLGGAGKGLVSETVFVSPHLDGLVYINPSIHQDVVASCLDKKDAVVLPLRAVLAHRDRHPECFAPMQVPVNTGMPADDPFESYARTLLIADQFPRLSKVFASR